MWLVQHVVLYWRSHRIQKLELYYKKSLGIFIVLEVTVGLYWGKQEKRKTGKAKSNRVEECQASLLFNCSKVRESESLHLASSYQFLTKYLDSLKFMWKVLFVFLLIKKLFCPPSYLDHMGKIERPLYIWEPPEVKIEKKLQNLLQLSWCLNQFVAGGPLCKHFLYICSVFLATIKVGLGRL